MTFPLARAVVLRVPASAVQQILFVPDGAAVPLRGVADGSTRQTCKWEVAYFVVQNILRAVKKCTIYGYSLAFV